MADRGRRRHELWTRYMREAEDADRATDGAPSLPIFDRKHIAAVLRRHGIGAAKLRGKHVDPKELSRLRKGEGIRSVSTDLLNRIVSAFPAELQARARQEIQEGLLTPQERALYLCKRFWQRRQLPGGEAGTPDDVPMFGTAGRLTFVRPGHPQWPWLQEQRDRDYSELQHRVEDLISSREVTAIGNDLRTQIGHLMVTWTRVLAPLLEFNVSGFTERHWSELTATELHRFLTAGRFQGEALLAQREDDLSRIRAALSHRGPCPVTFDPAEIPDELDDVLDDAFDDLDKFA